MSDIATEPSLKYKTVTYYEIEWTELEQFIEAVYGQKYDIISDMEWDNDSEHSFKVKKAPLKDYEANQVEQFKATGKGGYIAYAILDDLCNRGFILEGEYLINVCW